jgi:hypothetical protein
MNTSLNSFISGAIMMACWVAGLFFLRFWRETRDRFFAMFATSFWLLALERVILVMLDPIDETRTFVYLIRSLAFAVIVLAVVDKNRDSGRQTA